MHPQSVCHANYSNIAYTWSITETSAVLETPELLYISHREICNIIVPLDWSMLFGCNNIHLIYFCSRFKSVMNMFELGNLHGRPSHICYACVICDGYACEVFGISEHIFSHQPGCVIIQFQTQKLYAGHQNTDQIKAQDHEPFV